MAAHFKSLGLAADFVVLQARGDYLEAAGEVGSIVDLRVKRLRQAVWPLARYLRRERPDAILCAMWPLNVIAIWARALARVQTRLVISEHNTLSLAAEATKSLGAHFLKPTIRWFYPSADHVVAVSTGVAQDLLQIGRLDNGKISVIYNPVIGEDFDDRTMDQPNPGIQGEGGPLVLSVGSLKPQKDYPTLLRAFAQVRSARPARLMILGEGQLRGDLEALARELGIEADVTMPGFVANPYPYMKRADLFVLSSAWEGFGNVIVEALACGTPVVSTDCQSGPAEILDGGKYGALVPVGDPQALAQAMLSALDSPHDRAALTARGYDFTVERAASQYIDLLLPGFQSR